MSLVVVVLILAAAAILRDGRILGHDLREAHEAKALKNDTLEMTPDGAFVVNTKPLAKDVQGYGGPVPLKIHIKDGRVAAVEAEPNAERPTSSTARRSCSTTGKASRWMRRWRRRWTPCRVLRSRRER